jgi:hypothetical protein
MRPSHLSTSPQSLATPAAFTFSTASSRVAHDFLQEILCPFHPAFWHSAPQYDTCLQREQRLSDAHCFLQCEQLIATTWTVQWCGKQRNRARVLFPFPETARLFSRRKRALDWALEGSADHPLCSLSWGLGICTDKATCYGDENFSALKEPLLKRIVLKPEMRKKEISQILCGNFH